MKMSTLLMAMVLLVGATGVSLNYSLNAIFDEITKLNQSSTLVRDADPPALHTVSRQTLNCLSFSGLFCGRSEAPD